MVSNPYDSRGLAYGFEFNGQHIGSDAFGADYIAEFCRALDAFAPKSVEAVLEWGSGLTTQVLADYGERKWRTRLLLTIDENQDYQDAIFRTRPKPGFVRSKVLNQTGPCFNQTDPELNYSTYPLVLGRTFDLIFIDGRRRMECAFMALLLARPETIVILHDYRRTRYQPIIAFYRVLEDGAQFRVLQPLPDVMRAMNADAATSQIARALREHPHIAE